ncbi:MAG TPA: T9SS type A sorting domain-containing protein [Bacteroidales bacterium]|nr:T9SS type A sorting domain-containing protein [Bacteroidales bacterium]
MKIYQFLFVTYLLLCGVTTMAQKTLTPLIEYAYDASGNRILRNVVYLKSNLADPLNKVDSTRVISEVEINNLKISLYPNPTKGSIKLFMDPFPYQTKIEIILTNITGKQIIKKNLHYNNEAIELGNLPPGIYILRLNMESRHTEWKIIKE